MLNCLQIVGRSGEVESQEDVLMDEAPSNISQASTLQANREGIFNSFSSYKFNQEKHSGNPDLCQAAHSPAYCDSRTCSR